MTRLTKETKLNLQIWLNFLTYFNGSSMFLPKIYFNLDELWLYTYASGYIGYSAVFGNTWFREKWYEN